MDLQRHKIHKAFFNLSHTHNINKQLTQQGLIHSVVAMQVTETSKTKRKHVNRREARHTCFQKNNGRKKEHHKTLL